MAFELPNVSVYKTLELSNCFQTHDETLSRNNRTVTSFL